MQKQICLYGPAGAGKTSAIGSLAKHLWRTEKKRTLVITFDGGGAGPLEPGVSAGAIDLVLCDSPQHPYFVFNKIVGGFKPLTPDCSKFERVDFQKGGFGALAIEGLTAWGDALLDATRDRQAKGEQIGQMDGGKLGNFSDGPKGEEIKLGSNTMTHYGIAQSYLRTYVNRAKNLWSEVPTILWTALEMRGTDEGKSPIYGPHLAGKASTGTCIRWFTDVIHLTSAPSPGGGAGDRKFFLENHTEKGDPVPFLAKYSCSPDGKMPSVIAPDFKVFFEELEKANVKALEAWK